jgi:ligand-binding sensor domain-containing protein/anti-sigma regulatory factor (Ser/Thr protein kinase)
MKANLRAAFVTLLIVLALPFSERLSAGISLQPQIFPSSVSTLLKHPTVTAIFRDEVGVLWVGTQYGLYRLDGSGKRLFSNSSSGNDWIPASDIRAITENSSGQILVATFGGGVLQFDKKTDVFKKIEVTGNKSALFVTTMHYSKSGLLWIGSTSEMRLVNFAGIPIKKNFLNELNSIRSPVKIVGTGEGTVFVATKDSGIWIIDEDVQSVERFDFRTGNKLKANTMAYGLGNKLYIGEDTGKIISIHLDHNKKSISNVKFITSVTPPISSMSTYEEVLWVGTSSGLNQVNVSTGEAKVFTTENSYISNNHITSIFDDGKSVWIGTYQGLDKLRLSAFSTYNIKRGGISEDVLAFEEDSRGNLWVGTYNGLYIFRKGLAFSDKAELVETTDTKVMTIAENGDEIWVGFRQAGVQVINSKTFENIEKPFLDLNRLAVTKILHDCRGWTWIATYGDGLYLIRDQQIISLFDRGVLEEEFVTIVATLKNCGLIVGTETSIHRYEVDTDSFTRLDTSFEDATAPLVILSIKEDNRGNIWLGTKDQGIFLWEKYQNNERTINLQKQHINDQYSHASIYGIETDKIGNIWTSTQSGLIKLGESGRYLDKFDQTDGLQGNDFNFGASYMDSTGQLYFGGINGFSTFNPAEIVKNVASSDLLLTRIIYNESEFVRSIDTPQFNSIILDRKNHFITFQFSVLDFIDPDNNRFRHKLENFDPDWIDIDTRNTATYTNLPPGDYIFRVQGANSAGVWSQDGLSIKVTMLPPPWKTWWAFVGYTIFAMMFLWLWTRTMDSFAQRRATRTLETQMHENEERAYDELHEQFELNDTLAKTAHDHSENTLQTIRSFISTQQQYLTEEVSGHQVKKSDRVVSALATLETCLYFSNERLIADLRKFTQQRISQLLDIFSMDPEKLITINDVSAEKIPAQFATSLAIFINEALENSFYHAFDEAAPVHYIQVSFGADQSENYTLDTNYSLTVSDNGVGISDNISPEKRETLGFAIMHDMADRLSGRLEFSSGDGTRIRLSFTIPSED